MRATQRAVAPVCLPQPLRVTRALLRLASAVLHMLLSMAVMAMRFPRLEASARVQHVQWWALGVLRAAGLEVHVRGQPRAGAVLLLANHVSWLDIAAIHAVTPQARFVAKAEVLRWPLLGWLIRGAGTLFIERARRRDALRVVHKVAEALAQGDTVAVFPEGTTGDGRRTLPFHPALLQAAISAGVPVQAAVLRYSDRRHAFSPSAAYVGSISLLQSVWRVACADGLAVHVELLEAEPIRGIDRRGFATQLRQRIDDRLRSAACSLPSQGVAVEHPESRGDLPAWRPTSTERAGV